MLAPCRPLTLGCRPGQQNPWKSDVNPLVAAFGPHLAPDMHTLVPNVQKWVANGAKMMLQDPPNLTHGADLEQNAGISILLIIYNTLATLAMPGTVVFRPIWHLIFLLFPTFSSNSISDPCRTNFFKIWEPLFPPFGHQREPLGSKMHPKIDIKTRYEAKGYPQDNQRYPPDSKI